MRTRTLLVSGILLAQSVRAQGVEAIAQLPMATASIDPERREMVIELPPRDLPARSGDAPIPMIEVPLCQLIVPASVSLYSARVEMLDDTNRPLPQNLLHHFNLTDPGHRELFLPISLHLMAASKETPSIAIPRLLFGLPLVRGQRLIAGAMLANDAPTPFRGVRVRLVLRYMPGGGLWPVFRAYPWSMDVQYPLGHPPTGSKAFDLAPGRTVRSWEASPAVAGTILGLGGHLHDYGVSLTLTDLNTGELLWYGMPERDAAGHVLSLPVARFYRWWRLGIHIVPGHRYRLEATYENPTGDVITNGGMGAVAGLFIPDGGVQWPAVDAADSLYRQDLKQTILAGAGDAMMMMGHPSH